MWPVGIGDDLPEHLWASDSFTTDEDGSTGGLVSLAFLTTALKRRKQVWCALAVLGLVIGAGLYVDKPALYQASTTILLNDGPDADPSSAITTDAALAQSTAVGSAVVSKLGLPGSVSNFLGSYVVSSVGDQVLVITASAPTSTEAVREASAIAGEFLTLRAVYARAQQAQTETALNQQLAQAKQSDSSISEQVNTVSSQPSSPGQQKQLHNLQKEQQAANAALSQTAQNVAGSLLSTRVATQVEIDQSRVINTAEPLKHSRLKTLALYVGGGFFGGLILGLAVVAIGALASNRLRRRDDVAYALGSPVKLSVGPLRTGRLRSLRGKDSKRRERDMNRVVVYLRKTLPVMSNGFTSLAVVAVDDTQTAAQSVVELALSYAKQGRRVLLADLSRGRHAANIFKLPNPGVHKVSHEGAHLMVAIPSDDDVAPIGPIRRGASGGLSSQVADGPLTDAGVSADVVLTLATPDPAVGGEHLGTWASVAVAMVTAGASTSEKIHATGDLVRVAGVRLDSAVLIDADESDDSLGLGNEDYLHPCGSAVSSFAILGSCG